MTENNIKDIKQKLLGQKKKKKAMPLTALTAFLTWLSSEIKKKKKREKGKRSKTSVLRRLLIREQLYDVLVNVCF